MHSYKNIK